ncbi:hypothetical protein ADUPG1_004557, partial [Aduncisulcus paluster]
MILRRNGDVFRISGFGWTAGPQNIGFRLISLKKKSILAAWSAHEWTGRSAPYFKEALIAQRLLYAFPSLVSTRIHMLTARPSTPSQCPLCQSQNSQNHALGACSELMTMYRQRHHDIRSRLAAIIRQLRPNWRVEEEYTDAD